MKVTFTPCSSAVFSAFRFSKPHLMKESSFFKGAILCSFVLSLLAPMNSHAQITFVGSRDSSSTADNTSAFVIGKPVGLVVNDFMIAIISYGESSTGTDLGDAPTSTGWTLIQDADIDGGTGGDEWRVAVQLCTDERMQEMLPQQISHSISTPQPM
jgi:hypothetical protein